MSLGAAATDRAHEVLAREDARITAMLAADRAQLTDILAEDYTHTHNNGLVESRREYLEHSICGPVKYVRFEPSERRVRVYENSAVITGRAHVEVRVDSQPRRVDIRFTAVYVRQDSLWRIVAWQATPLPP